ncbi:MAG: hypothetical protein U9M90_02345 [Patescibacteria group bacterium]|nr:hypothetical protein [Patescibacteria group bacterium]
MTNRTKILIAVLFAATVGSAGFLFFLRVKSDRAFLQTKLVTEKAVDTSKKAARQEGKHSLKMMKKGYIKMLTGEVIEINSQAKSFVLDIDPLGKHKKYIIYTDGKTKFSVLTHVYANTDEDTTGLDEETNMSEEYTPTNFNAVDRSSQVCVRLNGWMDDSGEKFLAEKVDIIIE